MNHLIRAIVCCFAALVLAIFATQASAQQLLTSPPPVYVSGTGPTNTSCASVGGVVNNCTIYVQNGTVFTPVLTMPNDSFDSLAIGPPNAFTDTDASGNASHPFLLYACDTAGKTIIRIDPTAAIIAPQLVYNNNGPTFITPVCGRSTATGDFYVTDKSGPGVFQLIASSTQTCTQSGQPSQTVPVACFPFTANPIGATPVRIDTVTPMTGTGRGITQKYIGDLLVVDNAGNRVLHSVYATPPPALFSSLSSFITTNLNGPIGVANAPSLRQVFVSNSVPTKTVPAVSIFDATGAPATTPCPALSLPPGNSKQVPDYLATAPTANSTNTVINDTIFLVTNSSNAGTLWTWNTAQGNCTLISAATLGDPLSGVAVAPAPVTLTLTEIGSVANPVPTPFPFNSSVFQFTATGCMATVTAYPVIPATVNSMISLAGQANHEVPAVNLGDGGFETAYEVPDPSCSTVFLDGGFIIRIFNFVDKMQYTNPRILDCHNPILATEPKLIGGSTVCVVTQTIGVYPLGGPIPGDTGTGTKIPNFFAVVNENAGPGTAAPGQFCGFQSPLINTLDPSLAASFNPALTNTIPVKFKLADLLLGGTCKNGPFITNAVALISVAQLSPAFNAINVQPTASSLDQPPLFNTDNQQYQFTLNISNFAPGTYSLTVTFLSDNTTSQTILFIII